MSELHVLTTGEAAKYCGVNFRTVIRWIERGQLKAYKLPGRGDHRICVEDFVGFLRDNAMPIPRELAAASRRVLLMANNPELASSGRQALQQVGCDVEVAADSFSAGTLVADSKPAMIVIDTELAGVDSFRILDYMRSRKDYGAVRLLVLAPTGEEDQQRWLDAGADAVIVHPVKIDELVAKTKLLLEI